MYKMKMKGKLSSGVIRGQGIKRQGYLKCHTDTCGIKVQRARWNAQDRRTRTRNRLREKLMCSAVAASVESTSSGAVKVELPLTATQRLQRAGRFWGSTVPILLSYVLAGNYMKTRSFESEIEEEMIWDSIHEWGSKKLSSTINELKGFYVKSGQLISTRVDLFPEAYTSRLSELQDRLDPLHINIIKQVVSEELLEGAPLSSVFSEFDETPLGSASVAQVHKARLMNGKLVAVKVMRPNIEPKLRGDIQNIIKFSKLFRDLLPLDYFLVFTEIAARMEDELDFRREAEAMDKIHNMLHRNPDGSKRLKPPLHIPHSVDGMVTKRVLVMDYMDGMTLSQIEANSDKDGEKDAVSKLLGERVVQALTKGFGQMTLQEGLLHGDPHPGNIMILKNGEVALLDFGQTKQLDTKMQKNLSALCILLEEEDRDYSAISGVVRDMGVKLIENADEDALAACAVWMFDSKSEMPGGYSADEISENSPVRKIASFPQDLVMVGRAAVLVRGICSYFSVPWSVSKAWAPLARWRIHGSPIKEKSMLQQRIANYLKAINFARIYFSGLLFKKLSQFVPKSVVTFNGFIIACWKGFILWLSKTTTDLKIAA